MVALCQEPFHCNDELKLPYDLHSLPPIIIEGIAVKYRTITFLKFVLDIE